jgi:hypothetical protein
VSYAALTDRICRERADRGDKLAQNELVKRGLAWCPIMAVEAKRGARRAFRVFEADDERPRETNPMATR